MKGTITMAHGGGGEDSAMLMREIFGKRFANDTLCRLEDAAVLDVRAGRIAVSTDSFVVTPTEFPGGDIGKLAVCGTVNDVLMMGAEPAYLTCGFILEEGLELAILDRIAASMARAAAASGAVIVAGDTKVTERRADPGTGSSIFINTTGIGFLRGDIAGGRAAAPEASAARPGDIVIVSGNLGDHHACILSTRLGLSNGIVSDCAALNDVVDALYAANSDVHVMRDVTRGGLATVLNEIAVSSNALIEIDEDSVPVTNEVRAFCGVMGLDPVYMGNEGKMIAITGSEHAEAALSAMRKTEHGKDARVIGRVTRDGEAALMMKTRIGGTRRIPVLRGEGLPRIC